MVTLRFAILAAALGCAGIPSLALAHDVPLSAMAPADEYFGHARLSVLGIANTIRDSGARIHEGADPQSMTGGPLSFIPDAIQDWERQYPDDPWIARDLYGLEVVYLRARTPEGDERARSTADWLVRDYPDSEAAQNARLALRRGRGEGIHVARTSSTPGDAWERWNALRAPLPPADPN
jgi:hypothetical protein